MAMIGAVRQWIDRFQGGGDHALSVPNLDGPFEPNAAIENAEVLLQLAEPDNVVVAGATAFVSSGSDVLQLEPGGHASVYDKGDGAVTALAGAADGRLAIARSGGRVKLRSNDGSFRGLPALSESGDVTAMAFAAEGRLALTIGARGRLLRDWRRDLMERGRSGSAWFYRDATGFEKVADKLAFPYGVVAAPDGSLLVSVAWDSAVIRLAGRGSAATVLGNLPGYPARITAATHGGYWLAIFAPRNQLVELVLREKGYRERMLAELEPQYWICPQLLTLGSPLEVMQEGSQRVGGAIKPWAPSLSYGLIVRIGDSLLPEYSFHSRADGERHGITSVAEFGSQVLATTFGGGAVISIRSELRS